MRRGLLIPPGTVPEIVEAADWFADDGLRRWLGGQVVVGVVIPTPAMYRPELKLYYALDPAPDAPVNTTATNMAGPRLRRTTSVRGPAVLLVARASSVSDITEMDLLTLATAVVTAELGLPLPGGGLK